MSATISSMYVQHGSDTTTNMTITIPNTIDTTKKWCIGFLPSTATVIKFTINSIYVYAS